MLFDLRGRGRRRAVKVIYLGLAVLLGGGLVFFGVGGNVSGGLFDAFNSNGGSATKQIRERVKRAEATTRREPQNPRAWAVLAEAQYQYAGQSKGYNATTGQFSGAARTHLEQAKAAWNRHLQVAGDKPNASLAGTMRNALTALGDTAGAVRAQEIVLDGIKDPGFGDYAQLAVLAYQAGQTRKGDLASDRAVSLAPKAQRTDLKTQLESAKTQATSAGSNTTATPATPTG